LTKAIQAAYTSVPARTKTTNRVILHYLVMSSQAVKHRPQTTQCIYTALEKGANSIAYWRSSTRYWPKPFTPHIHHFQHVPKYPTALYYITYLSLANPSNIAPHAMHIISFGKIVKVLEHIDGHRRVIDQSL